MVCSHSRLFRPDGRRYVGAAQKRRRSVDLAKLRFEGARLKELQRHKNSFSNNVRFADLVVMAERLHPIPFRTRP